ncbi:MAG: serine hydrolase [Spirochaetes bacterium]|nr:serine hydrolase [Spirochaetota bacterium]
MRLYTAFVIMFCVVSPAGFGPGAAAKEAGDTDLEHVLPQTVGWSAERLEEARTYAEKIGSSAVVALYDGKIFFSWGDIERRLPCHSIRKPFLGALYGIYRDRGELDLALTVGEIGIDDTPFRLTETEKSAAVQDLLMSRSGVYHEAAGEVQSMRDKRPVRGSHPPGMFFFYNNWDFNVLGTIFEQQTREKIFTAFKREIADPIGMEDFLVSDCRYYYEKDKSVHPAYFFSVSARDMARFGLLYQNGGRWGGRQIVPADWITESTKPHTAKGLSGDGYGYMWSIIPEEAGYGSGFYHTGYGVHLLAVLPEKKLVLVHRVDTTREFDIRWPQIRTLMQMIVAARIPD